MGVSTTSFSITMDTKTLYYYICTVHKRYTQSHATYRILLPPVNLCEIEPPDCYLATSSCVLHWLSCEAQKVDLSARLSFV